MSYAMRVLARESGVAAPATAGAAGGVAPRHRSVFEESDSGSAHEVLQRERERPASAARAASATRAASEVASPREQPRRPRERDHRPPPPAFTEELPLVQSPRALQVPMAPLETSRPSAVGPPQAPAIPVAESPRIHTRNRLELESPPRRAEPRGALQPDSDRTPRVPPAAGKTQTVPGLRPRPIPAPLPLERAAPREPDIVVTIGRIELRGVVEPAPPARGSASGPGRGTLDQYLRRGAKGQA